MSYYPEKHLELWWMLFPGDPGSERAKRQSSGSIRKNIIDMVLPEDVKKLAETEIPPPEELSEDFAKLTFIPRSLKEQEMTM
ncbi:hypothetical protein AVEN_4706-1, partial [Araneus ventricosus]